jgi:hypothetical protein
MMHRFLTISGVPELRAESASTEADTVPEVEVLLPVDKYWAITEMIQEIRYLKHSGHSTSYATKALFRFVLPFVCGERERTQLQNIKV